MAAMAQTRSCVALVAPKVAMCMVPLANQGSMEAQAVPRDR